MVQSLVVQQAPTGTQVSPETQGVWLGGQLRMQLPAWQAWLGPQDLPHIPQLAGSVCRLEQNGCDGPPSAPPGHTVCDPPSAELQVSEHMPPLHRSPWAHGFPQPPQLLGLVLVLTQLPLHDCSPLVQPLSPPLLPPLLPPAPSPRLPSDPPSSPVGL